MQISFIIRVIEILKKQSGRMLGWQFKWVKVRSVVPKLGVWDLASGSQANFKRVTKRLVEAYWKYGKMGC